MSFLAPPHFRCLGQMHTFVFSLKGHVPHVSMVQPCWKGKCFLCLLEIHQVRPLKYMKLANSWRFHVFVSGGNNLVSTVSWISVHQIFALMQPPGIFLLPWKIKHRWHVLWKWTTLWTKKPLKSLVCSGQLECKAQKFPTCNSFVTTYIAAGICSDLKSFLVTVVLV